MRNYIRRINICVKFCKFNGKKFKVYDIVVVNRRLLKIANNHKYEWSVIFLGKFHFIIQLFIICDILIDNRRKISYTVNKKAY